MNATRQLALPFTLSTSYDAGDFLSDDSNAAASAWIDAAWPAGRLAVWGEAGVGKTHLLHVWTQRHGGTLLPGCGLPRNGLPACVFPTGGSVPSLVQAPGIAIDDADTSPEEPLLHLLNAAAEAGVPVLLAAREAPARWHTRLRDLGSRLRAMAVVQIHAPGDTMLRVLLMRLLAARQLVVSELVQDWLLLHLPRHPAALREAAARLDHAAMAGGRRVTRSLAAQIVAELTFEAVASDITESASSGDWHATPALF